MAVSRTKATETPLFVRNVNDALGCDAVVLNIQIVSLGIALSGVVPLFAGLFSNVSRERSWF